MLGIDMPGYFELIVILFVAILIFGRKLPEVVACMGCAIKEFRTGLKRGKENVNKQT